MDGDWVDYFLDIAKWAIIVIVIIAFVVGALIF